MLQRDDVDGTVEVRAPRRRRLARSQSEAFAKDHYGNILDHYPIPSGTIQTPGNARQ